MRQDLKHTPQKNIQKSHKKRIAEESACKELALPFPEALCHGYDTSFTLTPLKKQPEYLLSPSPIKKDLFSQLLGTELKNCSPDDQNQFVIQQQSGTISEECSEQVSENSMAEEEQDSQANWSGQSGIKKRKRKSTAQIKLLKQELDGEMNWTKQKITRMAQITGLSQSQVYKWCWDQKKKQNKQKKEMQKNIYEKRKMIRKEIGSRLYIHHEKSEEVNEQNQENLNTKMTKTKIKSVQNMASGNQTQKKIKKRLIFF